MKVEIDIDEYFTPEMTKEIAEDELRKAFRRQFQTEFRRKDVWDRTESPAVKILDEECTNARPLIRECVEKHIREYPFHELDKSEIGEVIYGVIMDRILSPKKEAVDGESD